MTASPFFIRPKAAVSGRLRRSRRWLRGALLACCASGAFGLAGAQVASFGGGHKASAEQPQERDVGEWLVRLEQASHMPSYTGTFVVSSANGVMSSARIWHVHQGNVEIERVEALSGEPRFTFRRNDAVVTFLPESHTVRSEQREAGHTFPNLFTTDALEATADFYVARQIGEDRVAGFDADIVQLNPRDRLRFGYRIWSEKRTGLMIKTQMLNGAGQVLEQGAFSELQLNAPIKAAWLSRMMSSTKGYKVEKSGREPTTAEAEGWGMKKPLPGFRPQSCYRHVAAASGPVVQWIFSDGLATVSLFMEPFDAARHAHEGTMTMGATHMLARRLTSAGADWWVTAVGEVPMSTLQALVDNLERRD